MRDMEEKLYPLRTMASKIQIPQSPQFSTDSPPIMSVQKGRKKSLHHSVYNK